MMAVMVQSYGSPCIGMSDVVNEIVKLLRI